MRSTVRLLSDTGLSRIEYDDRTVPSDIIGANAVNIGSVNNIRLIGHINNQTIEQTFGKLATTEVVLTDERVAHILERHPQDFALLEQYGEIAIQSPSIILTDSKNKSTIFMIKRLDETSVNTIIKLALSDTPNLKNSIITFYKIGDKRLNRLIARNTVLYSEN